MTPFPQTDIIGAMERKRENYQVCSVQYCVQQLCTVQRTHIWTDLTVVCWLDLAFLWLYCVLEFTCVRFSLGLFCAMVYLCFLSTMPRDWLRRTSPKWPILCWAGRKTLTQSICECIAMAVARSSSDDNAIRYVLPVLWMTSCLPIIGQAKATPIGHMLKVTYPG